MAADRHLAYATTGSSAILSADPENPILEPTIYRMTRCRDMAVRNFTKCEVGRSVVGPQYYIVLIHSSSLR